MKQLSIDGKKQAVVMIVTFRADGGKHYVVLGRRNPRPSDEDGKFRDGNLKLGNAQFCGGEVEAEVPATVEEACGERLWHHIAKLPEGLDRRVALHGIKEMSEELNINYCETDAMFKNAELKLYKTDQSHTREGQPQETHYLNFDMGWLSKKQVRDLQRSIAPNDDCIQTFIKRADRLKIADNGEIQMDMHKPEEVFGERSRLKRHFNGFGAEFERYEGQCTSLIEQHTENGEESRADMIRRKLGNIRHMHEEFRGMDGIDKSTIKNPAPRMQREMDSGTQGNGTILRQFLNDAWGIQSMPWDGKPHQFQPTPVWDR